MRLLQSIGFRSFPVAEQDAPLVHALTASSLLCVGLGLTRAVCTGGSALTSLNWNLFLAWMPLFFALAIRRVLDGSTGAARLGRARLLTALAVGWLLFFPNAPYLVTDFVHLKPRYPVPVWFDILLLMSFAWTGLSLGFLSLRILREEVVRRTARSSGRWFVFGALALCSFGVYVGRIGRWNSWDVLVHPIGLTRWCLESFSPDNFPEMMTFCGPMFLFLTTVHVTLRCRSIR